ncbi:MAG: SusD/RagB family nutrient-binding outer membrane lipoprotein [Bacteroides sp.]|nr:SusD/RagB family nutrient-binding outer membrane lipoprotein [Bacteroides sp.]
MKKIKSLAYTLLSVCILTATSCESLVDGINNNPNDIATEDIDAGLYMNTPELASIEIQRGVFSRLCALWTGQLIGVNQYPLAYYNYQVSQSTFSFDGYQSVITQTRFIQQQAPDNKLYQGMTRVMEALLFGTYASFYGDIPCSEVCSDVEYPKFDAQEDVFKYVQDLLDNAIEYLENETSPTYRQDYIFSGSVEKWLENAYTLKARYYLLTKEYANAYEAALKGISSDDNSMYFVPVDDDLTDNKNNYYELNTLQQGLSTSDAQGVEQCFMFDLMDERSNAKTDETARKAYYAMNPADATNNKGLAAPLEEEPIITYAENLLILAEAGARTQGFSTGLMYLNQCRAYLDEGGCANDYYSTLSHSYEAYTADDFDKGGLLNANSLVPLRALLREIIIERYVTGFTTFMPFDDARRLRGAGEDDIAIDIPLNTTAVTQHPERFFYPEEEMQSNINAPEDPGLYEPTPINAQ